jgi:putative ABC transport system substrate-binding protein
MASYIQRRKFLATLLGGAAAGWPLAASAHEAAAPVIGMIHSGLPETEPGSRMIFFRQGPGDAGYIEGQNVTIEYRWPEGQHDRYSDLVVDLIRRKVSLIATGANTPASLVAKATTSTIPIVDAAITALVREQIDALFDVGSDPFRLATTRTSRHQL